MDMSISHRLQFHGIPGETDVKVSRNNICGSRINNEMSHAIRRQREICGVDYFKPTNPVKVSTQTEKKGFSNKIQNISFTGAFLPQFSISSQIKTDRRNAKKVSKFGTLNRSKSSASITLSSGRQSHQTSPHSVMVTDLTCLQLADTLFSCDLSSKLSSPLKYTTYNGDRKHILYGESDKCLHLNFKAGATLPSLPETEGTQARRSSHDSTTCQQRKDSYRPNSGGVKRLLTGIPIEKEISPKSILKQNYVETQPQDSYKRSKYRTVSDRKKFLDESKYVTLKTSKIGLQCENSPSKRPFALDFDDKDKRSVRFNVSHEVIEYIPHEPVSN